MPTVKDTINAKIAGKKVVMYSKLGCPFCTMAKDVLKKYSLSGADYEVIEMGGADCGEMQDYLLQLTGGRTFCPETRGLDCILNKETGLDSLPVQSNLPPSATIHARFGWFEYKPVDTTDYRVPRVFIKGKCIGGGSETKALHDSGKLKALLA